VARQTDDPDSLLTLYRDLIHLRNEHEALRVGDWTLVEANSPRLYTFLRQTETETLLVIINVNRNPVTAENYSLDLELDGVVTAVPLYGLEPGSSPTSGGYVPFDEIPPQSVHIIQLLLEE
jgi:glycosidase